MTSIRHLMASAMLAIAIGGTMTTVPLAQEPTNLSETYESWTVQCQQVGEGEQRQRVCQMSQELVQQQTRQRVLVFSLTRSKEGVAKATVIAPFGLLLSAGQRVELNDKPLLSGAFKTCLPVGCVVEMDIPDEALDRLSAAEKVTVVSTATTGQPVRTDVGLKGFSAAYKRLSTLITG